MIAPGDAFVEWLETNGAGSYAASTVCGRNDRRYHGLLVAALRPPAARHAMLSKVEEEIESDDGRFAISTNNYTGVVHPRGYESIESCARDPFHRTVWKINNLRIEKTIAMPRGERSVAIRYRLIEGGGAKLILRPLVAFRQDHWMMRKNDDVRRGFINNGNAVAIRPYDNLPEMYFSSSAPMDVREGPGWYFNFEYVWESKRGFDAIEDLYNPFVMTADLPAGGEFWLCASLDRREFGDLILQIDAERRRRESLRNFGDAAADGLAVAGDSFIVKRAGGTTLFAGYPWFVDWGRDAMISIPGICIATGRRAEARNCIQTFLEHSRNGMLPNCLPDADGAVEYNSMDASLWLFDCCGELYRCGGENAAFVLDAIYPKLKIIMDNYQKGTDFGIRADADGFLRGGEPGVALTWMDARVAGVPVTPRHGRPIEIQALWYHANRIFKTLALARGESRAAADAAERMRKLESNFDRTFWLERFNYYSDCVDDAGTRDESLRPNQIFIMSLAPELAARDHGALALAEVRDALVTPAGVRTLAPDDKYYKKNYSGDPAARDGAYHQGTVWPWLLGPFARAWAARHGRTEALAFLEPILQNVIVKNIIPKPIYEVASGDSPHAPDGCFAQAWNVGELLRAVVELRNLKIR